MGNPKISIRLKADLLSVVNQKAKEEKLNRSEYINKAVAYYLLRRQEEKSKEEGSPVIISAINDSVTAIQEFIASREEENHMKETFLYKMLFQFVRRICAGIIVISDESDIENLKKIYKDAKIWELVK